MRYFKKCVGEKCYLSPINPDDVELYTAWLNDEEVSRNLHTSQMVISLPAEKALLERLAHEHVYAIVDAATDELLGNASLVKMDTVNRTSELGIFIGNKAYWGKGYGSEAMRLLLEFGFNRLNLHGIRLTVFEYNARAIACYRKLGFKESGRYRQALFRDGRYWDILLMDLLEDEWRAKA